MPNIMVSLEVPEDLYVEIGIRADLVGLDVPTLMLSHLSLMYESRERPRVRALGRTANPNPEKVERLIDLAKTRVLYADGWVSWHEMRPAYRDREAYEGWVWEALKNHPDIETYECVRGKGTTRRARARRIRVGPTAATTA